jgi:hypothetical protein
MGPALSTEDLLPGTRFRLDFGFIRASLDSSTPSKKSPWVVTSIDAGFNAYLLITDTATRYTWCFPTVSKAPPIAILEKFWTSMASLLLVHAIFIWIKVVNSGNRLFFVILLLNTDMMLNLLLALTLPIKMEKLNA